MRAVDGAVPRRPKWDKFSLDMLVTLAARAGQHCSVVVA